MGFVLGFTGMAMGAGTADVVFLVDESGSMSGEHTWLGNMVTALDEGLKLEGVTNNQYALVGFGGHDINDAPHAHTGWVDAATLSTQAGTLVTDGRAEDGWQAIDFALNNYSFRSEAAVNFVLVTDEGRTVNDSSLSYSGVLTGLTGKGALLNAVVDADLRDSEDAPLLGISNERQVENGATVDGYAQNGTDYTAILGGYVYGGDGSTEADYIDLALESGGAAWDLNQLRAGGNVAEAFTNAFIDIKVAEITQQDPGPGPEPIPEPATILLLGIGLVGTCIFGRKKMNK
jgi:hypothetical protein